MDMLRSCYSCPMVLDQVGNQYNVQWYFTDPHAPLYPTEHFCSLNYADRKHVPPGPGEVALAPRPYYKGAPPAWFHHTASWSTGGLADWYRIGAPGPAPAPPVVAWDGSRTFPGTLPAGLFPPPTPWPGPPPLLTSSLSGNLTNGLSTPTQWVWQQVAHVPHYAVHWQHNPFLGFVKCYPYWTLDGSTATSSVGAFRCTSYNAGTGVSVWDDPTGVVLAAGELLTLHGV